MTNDDRECVEGDRTSWKCATGDPLGAPRPRVRRDAVLPPIEHHRTVSGVSQVDSQDILVRIRPGGDMVECRHPNLWVGVASAQKCEHDGEGKKTQDHGRNLYPWGHRMGTVNRSLCATYRVVQSLSIAAVAPVVGVLFATEPASYGQETAVVAVDDSPTAEQLLAQAEEHASNNPAEAARLVSRVLDDFGRKLVRVPGQVDRFIDGRERGELFLRANPQVLHQFRSAQTGEAERLVASGDDRRVVETRLLTSAGLSAAVRETQRAIESAQFASARRLLDSIRDHPDTASLDPSTRATIECLTAWGNGDDATALPSVRELARSDDSEIRRIGERLEALARTPRVEPKGPIDPLSPAPFGSIPSNAVRLWSEPLENSLYARLRNSIEMGAIPPSSSEGSASSGRFLVSIPTVDGSIVLVNEGYVLRAYDAYSHQLRWYKSIGSPNAPGSDRQASDLEVAVVASDCILALSGHALGSERSGGGRLVCLDLETGQRRWDLAPDRLSQRAEFRELFFYGNPTVVRNTVVVLGRKVTPRLETVSTVIGVNLETGAVEWVTPIGAAPGIRTAGARPFTTPALDGGRVFVSTGAGTTSCIDAVDGRVRWIRRDPVPIREMATESMPWELGGAVVTTRGLLTLAPSGTELQLLAIESGEELDSIPVGTATAWGVPRYFLTDRARSLVYGIGDDIVAFRADDLRSPIWKFKGVGQGDPGSQPDNSLIGMVGRPGIRGRVQSGWLENGHPALIVPMLARALLLNGEDGTTALTIPCEGPANLVARDGVIAAVTNESLDVLVDAGRAQQILTKAVAERPRDADAIIGLVEFALRARDEQLLRSATTRIEPALVAVHDDPERRKRIVALLVAAAQSGLLGREGSDALFKAIVNAPGSATDRAIALVAQGDWLAGSDRSAAAIEPWRAVLADPAVARATILDSTDANQPIWRSGGDAALHRLERLAASRGAPSAATRASESAPTADSAAELERYADRMPCTAAAANAWNRAAELRVQERAIANAAGDAVAAIDAAIASADRAVVVETLDRSVVLMRSANLHVTVAQLLDRAVIAGFDVPLKSVDGLSASVVLLGSPASQFVERLPRPIASTELTTAQSEITAHEIRGVLAPVRDVGASLSLNTRSYLLVDRRLSCLTVPDLLPSWSILLRGDMPRIVPQADGVLVIDQPNREALAAELIDDAGHSRWRIDDLSAAVSDDRKEVDRSECLVLTGSEDVAVVRVDGVVSAFSLRDGLRRWQTNTSVNDVSTADAGETLIAISGTREGVDDRTSWIVAIEQSSGKIVAEIQVANDEQVRWVQVRGAGEIAFGTSQGVGRWQVFGSAMGIRWFSESPRLRATDHGETLGKKLVVTAGTDRTQILDWRSGLVETERFISPTNLLKAENSRRWLRSGSIIVGWSNRGIDLFTLDGESLGSSSCHDEFLAKGLAMVCRTESRAF